jgi:hypothetical protein
MQHPEGSRGIRRILARREAESLAMTPKPPKHLRRGRSKYGVPPTPEQQRETQAEKNKSDRLKAIEKFGEKADERVVTDRRQMAMSPDEVEDWLRRNGINDGVDRRKAERRRR